MNNYLLQLLKEVKTIIIPGLGAITLTSEATGEIMFMSYLKYDDGTLTKHIAEKEGWPENDAKNLVAKFVREVTAELDKGHSYDMYGFGSFKKVDGEIVFDQWNAGSTPSEPVAATEVPDPVIVTSEEPVQPGAKEEEKIDPIEEIAAEETIPAAPAETESSSEEKTAEIGLSDNGFDVPEETNAASEPAFIPEPHITNQPINDIPEQVKPEPDEPVSPKAIVEQEDIRKIPHAPEMVLETEIGTAPKEFTAEEKKKNVKVKPAVERAKPDKKKKKPIAYILWGIIVLVLGGATYVAVNFDSMKKQYPLLADMAGESHVSKRTLNVDSIAEANNLEEAPVPETLAAPVEVPDSEPLVDEPQPIQPVTAPEPAAEAPKPVAKPDPAPKPAPKPVAKPVTVTKPVSKPVAATSRPSRPAVKIGSPDPSKPYHVIAGSFSSKTNAEKLARKLISGGNNSTLVGEFNGMYRVSIASFATKDEALSAHSSYQSSVPGAWVFKWP